MTFSVNNNVAYISGANGSYSSKNAGFDYGKNAAQNYKSYIDAFNVDKSQGLNTDIFTSEHSIEEMEAELARVESIKMPPVNFVVKFAQSIGELGNKASTYVQGLMGFTLETLNGETSKSLEAADMELQETFGGSQYSAKAFDVNNDGKIDATEEAVSTVLADYLSKDPSEAVSFSDDYMNHLDGSFTNKGENKMLAFLNSKNYNTTSVIVKQIHTDLGLDEIQKEIL